MAFVNFMGLMADLESMGFFSFVLPWLLFLIIIQTVLNKVNMFDMDVRKTTIVAAIISFFVVNFVPAGMNLGLYLTQLFGTASMYIAGLLVIILFFGMGGYKLDELPGKKNTYMLVLLLIAVLVLNGVGGLPFLNSLSASDMTLLFMLALIVGVVWVLGSGDNGKSTEEKK